MFSEGAGRMCGVFFFVAAADFPDKHLQAQGEDEDRCTPAFLILVLPSKTFPVCSATPPGITFAM